MNVDIDRHNLAMTTFLDLRSHLRFVDFIATLGKFFFAVAGASNCLGLTLLQLLA